MASGGHKPSQDYHGSGYARSIEEQRQLILPDVHSVLQQECSFVGNV